MYAVGSDRWNISSRCSRVPEMTYRAGFPKSSCDVTSACTSVLHTLSGDRSSSRYATQLGVGNPASTANVCSHRPRRVELDTQVTYFGSSADVTSADVDGKKRCLWNTIVRC